MPFTHPMNGGYKAISPHDLAQDQSRKATGCITWLTGLD